MYNELKCIACQQAQTNSNLVSPSAHEIKKLKPTCIETDQAQIKSSRLISNPILIQRYSQRNSLCIQDGFATIDSHFYNGYT